MLKLAFIAILAFVSVAGAQGQGCREALDAGDPPRLVYPPGSLEPLDLNTVATDLSPIDRKLLNYLFPKGAKFEDGDPWLKFIFQVNSPEYAVKSPSGRVIIRSSNKPYYKILAPDFHKVRDGKRRLRTSIVSKIHGFSGPAAYSSSFYELVYKNYVKDIRTKLIELLEKVDELLPISRLSYGTIDTDKAEELSTLRIFDATPNLLKKRHEKEEEGKSNALPFQLAFKARELDQEPEIRKLSARIRKLMREKPDFKIWEIGKLSIDPDLKNGETRSRLLHIWEALLYREYLSKYPDGLFFIHVSTEKNLELFQGLYGFKIVARVTVPNGEAEPVTEYVLKANLKDFKKRIEARIGLNSP